MVYVPEVKVWLVTYIKIPAPPPPAKRDPPAPPPPTTKTSQINPSVVVKV